MVTQNFNEREHLLNEVDEKIDEGLKRGMDRIKLWMINAVVALVMASGGSAMTFYFAVKSSIELASNNKARLDSRTNFIALNEAQMDQVELELQKINPEFEFVETVVVYK